ncbi:gp53-like domain-containing protein [Asticcacaulis solisilvae]|uniref:gp53-like domain-containing protein n=1 Tax=Asticcacaulis solisilvae TaxID=1217274 RepID=UPI003FD7D289
MALNLIVTNAGRNALVDAANTGTNQVDITQVGVSATNFAVDFTTTALAGELKRMGTIAGVTVADNVIHVTMQDNSIDVYSLRSFALYLNDGTLFAVYSQAGVIVEKSAAASMMLSVDVAFADVNAANIIFGATDFVLPPATTDNKGEVELATSAETQTGTDGSRAVTPLGLLTAFTAWLLSFNVWRASNDGSGSGLDADLLDGQDGSWYSNIIARLGFTPANKAGDTFTGGITAPTVAASTSMSIASNTVWHAGNDGAGSGLDADMLDGLDSTAYVKKSEVTHSFANPGWRKDHDGFMWQWAAGSTDATGSEGTQTVNFPVAFPTACLGVSITTDIGSGSSASDIVYQQVGAPTVNGVTVQRQVEGGSDNRSTTPRVLAWGY